MCFKLTALGTLSIFPWIGKTRLIEIYFLKFFSQDLGKRHCTIVLLNKGENVAPDYIRVLYICTVFQNLPQMEAYPKAFLEGAENLSLAL